MVTTYRVIEDWTRDTKRYIREDAYWINSQTREQVAEPLAEALEDGYWRHRRSVVKEFPLYGLAMEQQRNEAVSSTTYQRVRDRRVIAEVSLDASFVVIDPCYD